MEKMMKKVNRKMTELAVRAKLALGNRKGASGVDIAVAILISVVIGALLLAGLYLLFDETVLPTLKEKIEGMFNYSGAGN